MASSKRSGWSRFLHLAAPFFRSEVRWRARALLLLLAALLLALSGLNLINSYVGRDFMTAVADRQFTRYSWLAVAYFGVFAASTVAAVFERYVEDRFGLFWREWLTSRLIGQYLDRRAYYRIQAEGQIDNADQRIAEDVRNFTVTALAFAVLLFNSLATAGAFLGILWSITPWLFLAAVLYSAAGSGLAILLGRRLVGLNYLQFKKEADFRYELVRTREHAECIAFLSGESREQRRLIDRLRLLVENYRALVGVSRNLGFFTVGYNYLIPFLPLLIAAPLYLRGEVEFGVVTQAAMAFSQVVGAFSLIVSQFSNLSVFAAVVARLGSLQEALEEVGAGPTLVIESRSARVVYDRVTLRVPNDGRVLIHELSLELHQGQRVLVTGPNGAGKTALFRATAGLWLTGQGRILRPAPDRLMFLPQRPFAPLGTLRQHLSYQQHDLLGDETRLTEALRSVGLESLIERAGGWDAAQDWPNVLSAGEQQLVAVARLLAAEPAFAYLDEPTRGLSSESALRVYEALANTSITYVSIDNHDALTPFHDLVVEIDPDGCCSQHSNPTAMPPPSRPPTEGVKATGTQG